ncbi:amidase [Acidocella sp.]|uniref:amidase n=1 Tax=Acidocella sp. TaxID=50710 RepID=UPI003D015D09
MKDPYLLTAGELAAAYRGGALSPVDAVESCLQRIATLDPQLHAFIAVYEDKARQAARASHEALRAGYDLGKLHGVPVALKDLIAMEGEIYTAGSKIHLNRRATSTATLVRKLIAAGAIILGKVHTVEFAFGSWGTNHYLGTPKNPWKPEAHYTPGGSSSGSGVAVAARLTPLAVGTDTGGSIRIPASLSGVTGLKTTYGRISTHGIEPLSVSLDTPGPMARNVEDAMLMYQALRGPDPLDPATLGLPLDDPASTLRLGVKGLRLGRITMADCGCAIHPETETAYEQALETLARLGAKIVPVKLPQPLAALAGLSEVMAGEAYAAHAEYVDDPASAMGPATRARMLTGKISVKEYLRLAWRRKSMTEAFLAALEPVEALLTPSTAHPAIPVAEVDETGGPNTMTRAANFFGCCALAVPCGMTGAGLPLSLQIMGRPYAEAMVLRVGWAFEQAGNWHRLMPPLPPG